MWGFTEQPSTLQNNQLIQSGGKKKSAPLTSLWHAFFLPYRRKDQLVFFNGTKLSHLQSRVEEPRGTPCPHLFIWIYLLVWVFSSQERNRNVFKEKRERQRELELQQSGLNLDWELIPSPISSWFPKSLTCNFPSVNLLKSPLMFLHLSLFLSVVFIDMHVNFSETQLGTILYY